MSKVSHNEYNKNYATLALNCALKNSKEIVSISEICRRDRNKNVINILKRHL